MCRVRFEPKETHRLVARTREGEAGRAVGALLQLFLFCDFPWAARRLVVGVGFLTRDWQGEQEGNGTSARGQRN